MAKKLCSDRSVNVGSGTFAQPSPFYLLEPYLQRLMNRELVDAVGEAWDGGTDLRVVLEAACNAESTLEYSLKCQVFRGQILESILAHLPPAERAWLRLVNKEWSAAAIATIKSLRAIGNTLEDSMLNTLKAFEFVTSLDMDLKEPHRYDRYDNFYTLTHRYDRYDSFYTLTRRMMTDRGLTTIASMPTLTALNMQSTHWIERNADMREVSDHGVRALGSLTNLVHLTLGRGRRAYNSYVTDDGIHCLGSLTALRTLALSGYAQVTDSGVAALATLSNLTDLDLERLEKVTDAGVSALARLTALTHLSLRQTSVGDAGVAALAPCTAMEELNLQGCLRLQGSDLALAAVFPVLTDLNMYECDNLWDEGITRMAGRGSLTALSVSPNLTDAGLAALATRLPSITRLGMEGRDITDEGLAALTSLTTLNELILPDQSRRITDRGVNALEQELGGRPSITISYNM